MKKLTKLAAVIVTAGVMSLSGAVFASCAKEHTHTYDDDNDAICNICGYERTLDEAEEPEPKPELKPEPKPEPADIAVNSVSLDKTSVIIKVGETETLTETVAPENATNKNVTWSTDNAAVATVENGVVTAKESGSATITVTTEDGSKTATCTVDVIYCVIHPEPEIPSSDSIKVVRAAGDSECAYLEWQALNGASWYNVYYKPDGGAFVQLDGELVRQYPDRFRADAVGLKAGTYSMKIVPLGSDGKEMSSASLTVDNLAVAAHERAGFAFSGGTSSGAYNEDGSIKQNAKIIYVTEKNKDEVSVTLNTGKKDETFTGLQNILNVLKKVSVPVDIRLIGEITSPAIDGKNNKNPNTVLIKETTCGVTFEGIGEDATANGWTLRLVSVNNVEVRNIGFMNTNAGEPDNITLEKDKYVWVHNCDLFYGGPGGDSDQAKGDGALDTKLSTNITHSYNHFWDSGKCNLQNMKESGEFNITYHHNWYDHSDSRHPRIRTATVHIYNNYFDGNAKYGVGVTMGASAFVENNYFRSTATMKPMMSSKQGTDAKGEGTFSGEAGGIIKAFGNKFDGKYTLVTQKDTSDKTDIDCYEASSRGEQVPSDYKTKSGGTVYNNFDTASGFYTYTVDTPDVAKAKVEKYAGRVGGGDFRFEFDDATEDSNYAIIPELKAKLLAYKGTLVKVNNRSVK